MYNSRLPLMVLGSLYLLFLGYLAVSARQLPELMASHFNASGQADDWMRRSSHLLLMAIAGLWVPLMLSGVAYVIRFVPNSSINIPHRDYWLGPERREETLSFFFHHFLWLACMMVVFFMGLQFLVVQANAQVPARLSNSAIFTMTGVFLTCTAAWVVVLVRRFRTPT